MCPQILSPHQLHRPNPDRRFLDGTYKFDDANRIESALVFG